MEGQGRSSKVKEGHGWSFPITGLTFQGRKVTGGWWVVGWGGGLQDYSVSPSPIPFPLDFGFWIWDLDLGLDLGLTIYYCVDSKNLNMI